MTIPVKANEGSGRDILIKLDAQLKMCFKCEIESFLDMYFNPSAETISAYDLAKEDTEASILENIQQTEKLFVEIPAHTVSSLIADVRQNGLYIAVKQHKEETKFLYDWESRRAA